MNQSGDRFFINNFNLIRLFAAAQVAHYHLVSIYQMDISSAHQHLVKFLGFFPGVPIFFFISGFLISKSWENSYSWKDYAIKRLGRIEPALIASVIFALLLTWLSGYFSQNTNVSPVDLLILILAKISILQFYNPDYLRDYGDGVMNGSLWTITVEIQFYILIPFVYLLLFRRYSTTKLVILILIFTLINLVCDHLRQQHHQEVLYKLLNVSFLPWFFMFLAGVLFQKNFDFFYKLLQGKFLLILMIYIALCYGLKPLGVDFGNSLNPALFIVLCCLTFSAAYSAKSLADQTLGNTDVSYGIYLYHMPIINFFLFKDYAKDYATGMIIFIAVILISLISWHLIENPSLKIAKKISSRYRTTK
jgi:peptidoglycan/LPS O-acetylase OafA/YrhL